MYGPCYMGSYGYEYQEGGGEMEYSSSGQRITRRQVADAVPLSFAQQRLWFLNQLMPGNPVHNISSAMRLKGRLKVAALEQALSEIVRRHEALRTTFAA